MSDEEYEILNAAKEFVRFNWSIYEDLKDAKHRPETFIRLCEAVEKVEGIPE